jgi:hypothetical protein
MAQIYHRVHLIFDQIIDAYNNGTDDIRFSFRFNGDNKIIHEFYQTLNAIGIGGDLFLSDFDYCCYVEYTEVDRFNEHVTFELRNMHPV